MPSAQRYGVTENSQPFEAGEVCGLVAGVGCARLVDTNTTQLKKVISWVFMSDLHFDGSAAHGPDPWHQESPQARI